MSVAKIIIYGIALVEGIFGALCAFGALWEGAITYFLGVIVVVVIAIIVK